MYTSLQLSINNELKGNLRSTGLVKSGVEWLSNSAHFTQSSHGISMTVQCSLNVFLFGTEKNNSCGFVFMVGFCNAAIIISRLIA